jgi:hypothetical protein
MIKRVHLQTTTKVQSKHGSRGTQVAHIARSRLDRANAVMVIRDYSQQVLIALPGRMTRDLGRPTENPDSADSISWKPIPTETFKATQGHESLVSEMLGPVSCGLGYTGKAIQLGQYGLNKASARLFWQDDQILSVAHHDPDVCHFTQMRGLSSSTQGKTTLHTYQRVLPPFK